MTIYVFKHDNHFQFYLLLNKIAAITPGIQPAHVKIKVSKIAPHPLSKTASGGQIIQIIARKHPIYITPLKI